MDTDGIDFEKFETQRDDCFLCHPSSKLLVAIDTYAFALSGLGPLSDGYTIIATTDHLIDLKSCPPEHVNSFVNLTLKVRSALALEFGGCVITEHGNLPVCNVTSSLFSHCHHPHLLLTPTSKSPLAQFEEYFSVKGTLYSNLTDALYFGSTLRHYIMVSPSSEEYHIFDASNGVPRQFNRMILAEQMGVADIASWKMVPNFPAAVQNAILVKELIKKHE